ncbi:septum site-determining protein MinC [Cyanobium sp. PCC 7001]|uniref:septum site-determining protein MinC n=1 Tax=Cyanobium sp. PCC 7001 TaxID=180281 RepID=UPI00018052E3|nr:septum site-determining protein MinC [Cyanobium sp. PCC 7001]EDY37839.1 septum site-determining protein MinC [Cyanobium sp. PCC 7001]
MTAPPLSALLLPSDGSGAPHRLVLPSPEGTLGAPELVAAALASASLLQSLPAAGALDLHAGAWWLPVGDLQAMALQLAQAGLCLQGLLSSNRRTLVAGAALGLEVRLPPAASPEPEPAPAWPATEAEVTVAPLTLHRGTLRSGDHLQVEGSVLLLGDVNPGARVSASGHVLVWGRLRGTAHAGCRGDGGARIVALQLRPLQLRIAAAVARGPQGSPPPGLAEQASLVDGAIRLEPAPPHWPLSD